MVLLYALPSIIKFSMCGCEQLSLDLFKWYFGHFSSVLSDVIDSNRLSSLYTENWKVCKLQPSVVHCLM